MQIVVSFFLKIHTINEIVDSFNFNYLIKYMGRYNWSQGNTDIVLFQELEKLQKKSRHNDIIITTLYTENITFFEIEVIKA